MFTAMFEFVALPNVPLTGELQLVEEVNAGTVPLTLSAWADSLKVEKKTNKKPAKKVRKENMVSKGIRTKQ